MLVWKKTHRPAYLRGKKKNESSIWKGKLKSSICVRDVERNVCVEVSGHNETP